MTMAIFGDPAPFCGPDSSVGRHVLVHLLRGLGKLREGQAFVFHAPNPAERKQAETLQTGLLVYSYKGQWTGVNWSVARIEL